MIARIRKWRYKRVAKKVSLELKRQYGEQNSYSAAELDNVIRIVGLSGQQREYAYAMFTDEDICNGFLSRIGSSRTARELRVFLGGIIFGGGSVGYGASWNRFHDYDDEILGGLESVGSSNNGGSSGGWADGGFDGGDSGGGDGGD